MRSEGEKVRRLFVAGMLGLVVGLLVVGSALGESGNNLLPNSNFEEEVSDGLGDGLPAGGWVREYADSIIVTENPHLGRCCLRVVNPGTPGSEVAIKIPLNPSTKYTLTVFRRADNKDTSEIGVAFQDKEGKEITYVGRTSKAAKEWEKIMIPFTTPPGTGFGRVFLRAQAPHAVVYYDDVSLTEDTAVAPQTSSGAASEAPVSVVDAKPGGNLVPNPGFEDGADGKPAGWIFERGKVVWDKEAKSGSRCAKIVWKPWSDNLEEQSKAVLRSEFIPYQGKLFQASCWMRVSMVEHYDFSYNAACDLEFYDGNKKFIVLKRVGNLNGTTGWRYLEQRIVPPSETGYFRVLFENNQAGCEAWLDDVVVNVVDKRAGETGGRNAAVEVTTENLCNIFQKGEKPKFIVKVNVEGENDRKFDVEYQILDWMDMCLGQSVVKDVEYKALINYPITLEPELLEGHENEYLRIRCVLLSNGTALAQKELPFGVFTTKVEVAEPLDSKFGFYEVFDLFPNPGHSKQILLHRLLGARLTRPCFILSGVQPKETDPINTEPGMEHASAKDWETRVRNKEVYVVPNWVGPLPEWSVSKEAVAKYGLESEITYKCFVDPEVMKRWAREIVKRYKDVFRYWYYFGEPPFLKDEWIEGYIRGLRGFYEGAKEADPECVVIAPGVTGVPVSFEKYLAKGVGQWCDIYSIHIYEPSVETYEATIRRCAELMRKYDAVKPIWDFETGVYAASGRMDMASVVVKSHVWHFKYGYDKVFWCGALPNETQFSLIDTGANPYPGFFAYRTITDRLETPVKFAEEVALSGDNLRLFRFQKKGVNTYVLWNKDAPVNVGLDVGKAGCVTITDIFGRRLPLVPDRGKVGITVAYPVFIEGVGDGKVNPGRALLELSRPENHSNLIRVKVCNVSDGMLKGRVRLKLPLGWVSAPEETTVSLSKDESKTYDFQLNLPLSVKPWTYYVVAQILQSNKEEMFGEAFCLFQVYESTVLLDVLPPATRDNRSVRVRVTNTSQEMLNGRLVVTTTLTDHDRPEEITRDIKDIKPKETREVLFPVPRPQHEQTLPEAYVYSLVFQDRNGNALSHLTKNLGFRYCLRRKTAPVIDANLDDWSGYSPVYVVDKPYFFNQGVRDIKYWKGIQDLSFKVYAAWDESSLYLVFDVTDDIFRNSAVDWELWNGDAIQVQFKPRPESSGFEELNFALTSKGPQVWRTSITPEGAREGRTPKGDITKDVNLMVKRLEKEYRTIYELRIPAKEIAPVRLTAGESIYMIFQVNDDDGQGFKKFLGWDKEEVKEFDTITFCE